MNRLSTGSLADSDRQRLVPLRGRITRRVASCCINRMLVLAAENPHQPILMYIDSPGGLVTESLSIIATIEGIKCPMGTLCRGETGGVAALIAAHGNRGARVAIPDSRFSFKQLERDAQQEGLGEGDQFLKLLAGILGRDVQKPEAEVLEWFRQGAEFTAQEALKQGLIDLVSNLPIVPVR
jgi:ATP-dependent Clp protease protease subunit